MYSFVLILLIVLIVFYIYQNISKRELEGLGTQNQLPAYFSPFTLNNMPLKMTYWANRLNGDPTTGNIDPYTVANDLKTTSRTLNIILYGDENGVNQKFIGMMSSVPFTINNLPVKMNLWANRLNGDPTGGTTDPQSIAHEIQYCSTLLVQALNGGGAVNMNTNLILDNTNTLTIQKQDIYDISYNTFYDIDYPDYNKPKTTYTPTTTYKPTPTTTPSQTTTPTPNPTTMYTYTPNSTTTSTPYTPTPTPTSTSTTPTSTTSKPATTPL